MADKESLLRAVLDDPENDQPRLAYAALLEGRSNPRGEFIRLQCALANGEFDDSTRPLLLRREQELLERFGQEWLGSLRGLVLQWTYRRGFLEQATVACRDFLARAEELFAREPERHLHLIEIDFDPDRISLENPWGTIDQVTALAASPFLDRLATLDGSPARSMRNGDAKLATLLASPYLGQLTSLIARRCSLSEAGAAALARSPVLARLTELKLGQNRIGPDGVLALLGSGRIGRLTVLELAGEYWSDPYGADCGAFPNVGEEGVVLLASSPAAAGLRTIDLMLNELAGRGLGALVDSPYLADLMALYLNEAEGLYPQTEDQRERWEQWNAARSALVARFGDRVHFGISEGWPYRTIEREYPRIYEMLDLKSVWSRGDITRRRMTETEATATAAALAKVQELLGLVNADLERMPGSMRASKWHLDRVATRQDLLAQRDRLHEQQRREAQYNEGRE
jgi:uncharacterized protein (TIGR02996 family)